MARSSPFDHGDDGFPGEGQVADVQAGQVMRVTLGRSPPHRRRRRRRLDETLLALLGDAVRILT